MAAAGRVQAGRRRRARREAADDDAPDAVVAHRRRLRSAQPLDAGAPGVSESGLRGRGNESVGGCGGVSEGGVLDDVGYEKGMVVAREGVRDCVDDDDIRAYSEGVCCFFGMIW